MSIWSQTIWLFFCHFWPIKMYHSSLRPQSRSFSVKDIKILFPKWRFLERPPITFNYLFMEKLLTCGQIRQPQPYVTITPIEEGGFVFAIAISVKNSFPKRNDSTSKIARVNTIGDFNILKYSICQIDCVNTTLCHCNFNLFKKWQKPCKIACVNTVAYLRVQSIKNMADTLLRSLV